MGAMGVDDWNWRYPLNVQDYPWDCSAASLAWALSAYGFPISEQEVILGLGPERISATYGLLDASGTGLVSYLAEIGIPASNNPDASWDDLMAAAGFQPMVIGGRGWCHWSGVRMGSTAAGIQTPNMLALANPAPGYMGVEQLLYWTDFGELGPFSAVWFPV